MKIDEIVIPQKIAIHIKNQNYTRDTIGRSHSSVILFDKYVLKIESLSVESKNELILMKWLKGRLPVPEIIAHCEEGGYNFLLMSRLEGDMLYEVNNSIELYVKSLKQLKEVDYKDCPVDNRLEHYLKQAQYNIDNDLVDLDNVDPDTFGPKGFKDSRDLLQWLKDNQPEEELSYSHGDLCMPNILVKNNEITGYIDLGRGGICDRYRDIALCYRSYLYNTETTEEKLQSKLEQLLGFKLDMEKVRYYILIDELF